MDDAKDIINQIKEKNMTMAELIEEIKMQICDHYCKYPEQYKVANDDINFDTMLHERCNNCILDLL